MSDYYDIEVLKVARRVGTQYYGKPSWILPVGTTVVVKIIHGSGGSSEKQRFTKAGGIKWIRNSIEHQGRSEIVAISQELVQFYANEFVFWGLIPHKSYGKEWYRLNERGTITRLPE